jgi:Methyltransferase domain
MQGVKPQAYCSRWDFILSRCDGRAVLHLGFIGETDATLQTKLHAIKYGQTLHSHLIKHASKVAGVDRNQQALAMIRSELGWGNLYFGDVEHLEDLNLNERFDVVLFGDLVEHLTCPGLALNGIRRFMSGKSQLIISTPNSFALLSNIRFTLGRYREGEEHVTSYSKLTLKALLERHGFEMTELFTCYDKPPVTTKGRLKLSIGAPYFKVWPERGGTLLAVAEKR